MRSLPSCWNKTLAKLGFKRKQRKSTLRKSRCYRRPTFETLESKQLLAADVYTITTLSDVAQEGTAVDNLWSLREALAHSAADGGSETDIIDFDSSLSGGTLSLDSTLGNLDVDSVVNISGLGQDALTIDAQGASRVFEITSSSVVEISGLTVTGGYHSSQGGGVLNEGTLTLEEATISENTSGNRGGGLLSAVGSSFYVINSSFDNNIGSFGAGAYVYTENGGVIDIQGSTFSNNSDNDSDGSGGGLFIWGETTGTGTEASVSISNSTFTGNDVDRYGGAIRAMYHDSLEITNSTFTENTADTSGGAITTAAGSSITIHNSIVAGNSAPSSEDAAGSFSSSSSYNVVGDVSDADLEDTGDGNVPNVTDPLLSSLGNYGGPTRTHVPLEGSPAINVGSNSFGGSTDQRGFTRDSTPDIGAVEAFPPTVTMNSAINVDENGVVTISNSFLETSDTDDSDPTNLTYTLDQLGTEGTLYLFDGVSNTSLSLGDTFTQDDIDSGNLTYQNDATVSSADSFDFKVTDVHGHEVSGTFSIVVQNVAPVAQSSDVETNEDTAYTFEIADFNYTDAGNDPLSSITISNLNLNGGTLTYVNGTVSEGETINDAEIDSLVYSPAADVNGTLSSIFTFTVNDGDSGTVVASMDVVVNAVNDAPEAEASYVTTDEDTSYTFDISDFDFTDVEGEPLSSITISNLNLQGGTLIYSNGTVSEGETINDAEIDSLVYSPAADVNGTLSSIFTFTVNDGGTGTVAASMDVVVNAVNDAPEAEASYVTTDEDTSYTFDISDFDYADVEGDSIVLVTVSNLNLNGGTLTSEGQSVSDGDFFEKGDLEGLVYTPPADQNGTGFASFDFVVSDSFSGNGVVSATMTIDVTAVNDAPEAEDNTVYSDEDTDFLFSLNDFIFTDVENDALYSILISNLNLQGGNLTSAEQTITNGTLLEVSDIEALVFSPAADFEGTATFDFVVGDSFSSNGIVAGTMSIVVIPVNDAPTILTNGGAGSVDLTVAENSTFVLDMDAFDVDSGDSVSYSISNGADADFFSISTDGILTFASATDYESPLDSQPELEYYLPAVHGSYDNIYEVAIVASDLRGLASTQLVRVEVTDVSEAPTSIALSQSNIPDGTDTTSRTYSVGTLSAFDADANSSFTYTIVGGADQSSFSIGGDNNDELLINQGVTIDFATQASYDVTVEVSDGTNQYNENLTITISQLSLVDFETSGTDLKTSYEIAGAALSTGYVQVWASLDGQNMDTLLMTEQITDSGLLAVGSHEFIFQADFSMSDIDGDYYLVAELVDDLTPALSSNSMTFAGGVFQETDGTIHVQTSDADDVVDISDSEISVTINGSSTVLPYNASDVYFVDDKATPTDDMDDTGTPYNVYADGDYTETGTWSDNGNESSTWAQDRRFAQSSSTPDTHTATWTFSNLEPGYYQVATTWQTHTNRSQESPFSIYDDTDLRHFETINQEIVPAADVTETHPVANSSGSTSINFQYLGEPIYIGTGTLVVTLSNASDGQVIADAMRLERIGLESPLVDVPVYIRTHDGDDEVNQNSTTTLPLIAYTGDGDDIVSGGDADDTVFAGQGSDIVVGGDGNDIIVGGDGEDDVQGGLGLDILIGGEGSDTVAGDEGEDIVIGGTTLYDDDLGALEEIRTEWTTTEIFEIVDPGAIDVSYVPVVTDSSVFTDNGGRVVLDPQTQVDGEAILKIATRGEFLTDNLYDEHYVIDVELQVPDTTTDGAGSFVLYDYVDSDDFKFAGIEYTTTGANLVIGHKTGGIWINDATADVSSLVNSGSNALTVFLNPTPNNSNVLLVTTWVNGDESIKPSFNFSLGNYPFTGFSGDTTFALASRDMVTEFDGIEVAEIIDDNINLASNANRYDLLARAHFATDASDSFRYRIEQVALESDTAPSLRIVDSVFNDNAVDQLFGGAVPVGAAELDEETLDWFFVEEKDILDDGYLYDQMAVEIPHTDISTRTVELSHPDHIDRTDHASSTDVVERTVYWLNIGSTADSTLNRDVGLGIATDGWIDFVTGPENIIQPVLNPPNGGVGVRRIQLHNPFGRSPKIDQDGNYLDQDGEVTSDPDLAGTEQMEIDQYDRALGLDITLGWDGYGYVLNSDGTVTLETYYTDPNNPDHNSLLPVTELTDDFVDAWEPVVNGDYTYGEKVEVTAYVGGLGLISNTTAPSFLIDLQAAEKGDTSVDPAFLSLTTEQRYSLFKQVVDQNIQPFLDAGMSLAFDATTDEPQDSFAYRYLDDLRKSVYPTGSPRAGEAIKVSVEAWPKSEFHNNNDNYDDQGNKVSGEFWAAAPVDPGIAAFGIQVSEISFYRDRMINPSESVDPDVNTDSIWVYRDEAFASDVERLYQDGATYPDDARWTTSSMLSGGDNALVKINTILRDGEWDSLSDFT